MDMREHHLGLREAERKYNVQHSVIQKWERIYFRRRSRRSYERKTRQSLQNEDRQTT